MRIITLAVAAVMAISFAATASAAKKKKPTVATFEQCEQLAVERGVPHGQTGHTDFVRQCMGLPAKGRQI
jgi:anti-sigma-K factor RskA